MSVRHIIQAELIPASKCRKVLQSERVLDCLLTAVVLCVYWDALPTRGPVAQLKGLLLFQLLRRVACFTLIKWAVRKLLRLTNDIDEAYDDWVYQCTYGSRESPTTSSTACNRVCGCFQYFWWYLPLLCNSPQSLRLRLSNDLRLNESDYQCFLLSILFWTQRLSQLSWFIALIWLNVVYYLCLSDGHCKKHTPDVFLYLTLYQLITSYILIVLMLCALLWVSALTVLMHQRRLAMGRAELGRQRARLMALMYERRLHRVRMLRELLSARQRQRLRLEAEQRQLQQQLDVAHREAEHSVAALRSVTHSHSHSHSSGTDHLLSSRSVDHIRSETDRIRVESKSKTDQISIDCISADSATIIAREYESVFGSGSDTRPSKELVGALLVDDAKDTDLLEQMGSDENESGDSEDEDDDATATVLLNSTSASLIELTTLRSASPVTTVRSQEAESSAVLDDSGSVDEQSLATVIANLSAHFEAEAAVESAANSSVAETGFRSSFAEDLASVRDELRSGDEESAARSSAAGVRALLEIFDRRSSGLPVATDTEERGAHTREQKEERDEKEKEVAVGDLELDDSVNVRSSNGVEVVVDLHSATDTDVSPEYGPTEVLLLRDRRSEHTTATAFSTVTIPTANVETTESRAVTTVATVTTVNSGNGAAVASQRKDEEKELGHEEEEKQQQEQQQQDSGGQIQGQSEERRVSSVAQVSALITTDLRLRRSIRRQSVVVEMLVARQRRRDEMWCLLSLLDTWDLISSGRSIVAVETVQDEDVVVDENGDFLPTEPPLLQRRSRQRILMGGDGAFRRQLVRFPAPTRVINNLPTRRFVAEKKKKSGAKDGEKKGVWEEAMAKSPPSMVRVASVGLINGFKALASSLVPSPMASPRLTSVNTHSREEDTLQTPLRLAAAIPDDSDETSSIPLLVDDRFVDRSTAAAAAVSPLKSKKKKKKHFGSPREKMRKLKKEKMHKFSKVHSVSHVGVGEEVKEESSGGEEHDSCEDSSSCSSSSSAGPSCGICIVPYEDGDLIKTLPCGHEFHGDCVDTWLHVKRTCPFCRYDVTGYTSNARSPRETPEHSPNPSLAPLQSAAADTTAVSADFGVGSAVVSTGVSGSSSVQTHRELQHVLDESGAVLRSALGGAMMEVDFEQMNAGIPSFPVVSGSAAAAGRSAMSVESGDDIESQRPRIRRIRMADGSYRIDPESIERVRADQMGRPIDPNELQW